MNPSDKTPLLAAAQAHVQASQRAIAEALVQSGIRSDKLDESFKHSEGTEKMIQGVLRAYSRQQLAHLEQLLPSPYFTRLNFETLGIARDLYIGKFSFPEAGIYSWITPVAKLRFEDLGNAGYTRPNGSVKTGTLQEKDQFVIAEGKITFFAKEKMGEQRTLIYQEHFTRTKKGFVLQDVVDKMEKAQDTIIRADHHGPLVISGPAGSGKTTLALHRTAFLLQSPETAEMFPPERLLVLVQDEGTKSYFSTLLPDLGIKGIDIQTFALWAVNVLGLKDVDTVLDVLLPPGKKERYIYKKLQALRSLQPTPFTRNIFPVLKKVYASFFEGSDWKTFSHQRENRYLDRIDLTILLKLYQQKFGTFEFTKPYYVEKSDGTYTKRTGQFPANYHLLIIDEFQNYLPEQLEILNACMNRKVDSVIYVGDLKQQTLLGTISSWNQLDRQIQEERLIQLQKVYRNTQEILRYISGLGYQVDIPTILPEGDAVEEHLMSTEETIVTITEILKDQPSGNIGVLAHTKKDIAAYAEAFQSDARVHTLTFQEAQGVEFETVCIVAVSKDMFAQKDLPEAIQEEQKNIEKDILYVALTRAMNRLLVFGDIPLAQASSPLF